MLLGQVAAGAYALAATLWLASLTFRLTVTARVAADFVRLGSMDSTYRALSEWSGGLFVAFTLLAGTSLAAIGVAVLIGGSLPAFAGWFTILIGRWWSAAT